MIECCKKVVVTASGPAADIQWDRMGVYSLTGKHKQWRPLVYRWRIYNGIGWACIH